MRVVTTYYCELCNTGYPEAAVAQACEAQGPGVAYPIGMMWRVKLADETRRQYALKGVRLPHAESVTYAVATLDEGTGHHRKQLHFCMMDGTHPNTTVGDVPPGGPARGRDCFFGGILRRPQPPDPSLVSFRRMVDALRAAGIEPSIWDGEKAVPLPPEGL